ncbi:TPA: hypothetical protein ACX3DX_004517 [Vibrio parahaemolyticus]
MNDLNSPIWLMPDWSFASIVLLGTSISRFIEAKSNREKDNTYRLFLGVRMLTFFLILGVMTLALSVVNNINSFSNDEFIITSQITIFVISIISVFYTHYLIRRYEERSWFNQVRDNRSYFLYAVRNAEIAKNRLRYLNRITLTYGHFSKEADCKFVQSIDDSFGLDDLKKELDVIRNELEYLTSEIERREKT